MTFEQFKYFLDAYGGSIERWPAERRAAASAFVADSPAAAAALAEARRLDGLLNGFTPARDIGMERRIAARVTARIRRAGPSPRAGVLEPLFSSLWSRTAVLAAVALLSVMTGFVELQTPPQDSGWADYGQFTADNGPIELAGL